MVHNLLAKKYKKILKYPLTLSRECKKLNAKLETKLTKTYERKN